MKYEIFTCPFLNNVIVPSLFLMVMYPVMITVFFKVFENVFHQHVKSTDFARKFKPNKLTRRWSCPDHTNSTQKQDIVPVPEQCNVHKN